MIKDNNKRQQEPTFPPGHQHLYLSASSTAAATYLLLLMLILLFVQASKEITHTMPQQWIAAGTKQSR
jgi:hypothetical protein